MDDVCIEPLISVDCQGCEATATNVAPLFPAVPISYMNNLFMRLLIIVDFHCCKAAELEFLKSLWGLGTEEEEGYRTGPPGYIGWRNSFLGIDSGAPYTFKNTGSVTKCFASFPRKTHWPCCSMDDVFM